MTGGMIWPAEEAAAPLAGTSGSTAERLQHLPAHRACQLLRERCAVVVGLADSVENDSFRHGILDYPHYTRPREVEGVPVPEVLVSGNHQAIADWRRERALEATRQKRPDLLESDGRRSGGADICCKSAEETA